MRDDGTVLPAQLTGLCRKQQLHIERYQHLRSIFLTFDDCVRCVMQAHWAGLFPNKSIPSFDRAVSLS